MTDPARQPRPDRPSAGSKSAEETTTGVGRWFHFAERLVYILVAALLLLAALAMCGYAAYSAFQEAREPGHLLSGLFTLLSDLLLVLILMELLRTVGRFIRKEEPGVGVADLTPFLVVGAISATRRILVIGANLSIAESHKATQDVGGVATPAHIEPEHFRQAMIELSVNGGLVLVITLCLLFITRQTPETKEAAEGDEH